MCGLKWSPDGRYLASGGNDNLLNIWAQSPGTMYTQAQPLHSFRCVSFFSSCLANFGIGKNYDILCSAHQAAVKAVSWCPWQPHVLASGGGTADRCIRFWNCNSGVLLNTVDTRSQVCQFLLLPGILFIAINFPLNSYVICL